MVTPTRIARGLGILGVIAFMAVATGSSIATSNLQDDPAAALAPALPAGLDDPTPAPGTLDPAPALPDAAPAPTKPEPLKDLPAAPDEPALKLDIPPAPATTPRPTAAPAPIDEPAANPLPPAREREPIAAPEPIAVPEPAPAARPRPSADDPDAKARSFVERNRKEADEQLKALREEAAQLKARLGRVEAGIRRWESLAEALDRSEDRAAMRNPAEVRGRSEVQQYIVPGRAPVIIQSQPVTRSDYVPAPLPR
ncbi:hypothetical protein [Paludisphaera soli]|uniref:hypothetical protein n=1 Tax=Paludisphaera soli TaxID=2712865 RepID=UPI0013EDEABE|nr:hypothetical protein [Paludisphaera soli]